MNLPAATYLETLRSRLREQRELTQGEQTTYQRLSAIGQVEALKTVLAELEGTTGVLALVASEAFWGPDPETADLYTNEGVTA